MHLREAALAVLQLKVLVTFAAERSTVTPVQQVIGLISELKKEVTQEGVKQADTYAKFACFCKDKSTAVSDNILKGKDELTKLSCKFEEASAQIKEKQEKLKKAINKKVELKNEYTDAKARLTRETGQYEKSDADMAEAISSLEKAITSLESSQPAATGFMVTKQAVKRNLALAEAMRLVDDGPKWSSMTSFLQEDISVDPSDPEYKFHSQSIIDILQELEKKIKTKKNEADAAWAKSKKNIDDIIQGSNKEQDLNEKVMSALKIDIDNLITEASTVRGYLVEASASLQDDKAYMKELTDMCESRAKEWDQRTKVRAGELTALSKALDIMKDTGGGESSGEGSLLLLQRRQASSPSSQSAHQALAFLQSGAVKSNSQDLTQHVLDTLRKEGRRLRSRTLSTLAMRVASDPFAKVKTLIQNLIERLISEATQEATKKGFCDKAGADSAQQRDFHHSEVKKLNAALRGLESSDGSLNLEVEDLKASIATLGQSLKDARESRAAEKEDNLKAIKTAKDGAKATKQAISLLKGFYRVAARSKALVQVQASPLDDTAGAGFKGTYKGKQQAAKGIIGLLEVIKNDFLHTEQAITDQEKQAVSEYSKFIETTKSDIAAKTTQIELVEEDLAGTKTKLASQLEDLKTNMNLVDNALKEMTKNSAMCVENGQTYEQRKLKREEEMAALKKALCTLDTEGIEDGCT